jgi:ATP-dependent 26S proteasome regulatory subunit
MHGPPGTGKTLLAKAVPMKQTPISISIQGPEIKSKYVGDQKNASGNSLKKQKKTHPA